MDKKFSVSESSELFLKEIYDVAKEKGVSHNQSTYDIGEKLGITDHSQIDNIYQILLDKEFIKKVSGFIDGNKLIHISGHGQDYIETDGETGILKSVKGSVSTFIDNSINFGGDNLGQAFN